MPTNFRCKHAAFLYAHAFFINLKKNEVGDRSRGRLEGPPLNSYNCCIVICYNYTYIHIYAEYILTQWIIKTSEDFFRKICTSHFIVSFTCERELETEQKLQYIDPHPYDHQDCVFLVLQGCSTGGPEGYSAWCWLSLLHLVTNRSPNYWGARGSLLLGAGFPYHILSPTSLISNSIGGPKGPFYRVVVFPTTLTSKSLSSNSLTSSLHRVI